MIDHQANSALAVLLEINRIAFQQRTGCPATWVTSAPGRVNTIGDHTDYSGGFALPMAIDRHTVMSAAENQTQSIQLYSAGVNQSVRINLEQPIKPTGDWSDYARGVIAGYLADHSIPGLDIVCHNNLAQGAGLSSSASFELALATLIEKVLELEANTQRKIDICQSAEHHYVGVPCGILDQFSVANGRSAHLMLLDCQSASAQYIPFDARSVSWIIIQSGVKHELADGAYAERHAQCQKAETLLGCSLRNADASRLAELNDSLLQKRCQHVISENQRVLDAADHLQQKQWQAVGALMQASHASLRDDYEVSCTEVDALVKIANSIEGVYGARMTGGGFGGAVVALINSGRATAIIAAISKRYLEQCNIIADGFEVHAVDGAKSL